MKKRIVPPRAASLPRPRTHAPPPAALQGDTDAQTRALLEANANFGMKAGQVTIVKQEKVACLADNDARLAADPRDPYKLLTKPHG